MGIKKKPIYLILLWFVVNLLFVFGEARIPGSDVFLFKDAGVNLALHGKFVATNLANMPPFQEAVYAYYPPIYPFIFGVWSKIVGVGLKQSIAFDCLIRGLRTLLLFLLVVRLAPRKKLDVLLAGLFLFLSFVSVDPDRPDDLAHVFGILSLWVLAKSVSVRSVCGAAVLLGLTAGASPAGAVFYGFVMVFYLWQKKDRWKFISVLAALSLSTFFAMNLPIRLSDPLSYARFSKQLWRSNFPYAFPGAEGWAYSFSTFSQALKRTGQPGVVFAFLIFVLATGAVAAFIGKNKKRREGWPRALFAASAIYIPLKVFVWTLQPYYFWFPAFGFLIFLLLDWESRTAKRIFGVVMLAIAPLVWAEVRSLGNALVRPKAYSRSNIAKEIESVALPEHKIAVSPDAFFTLRTSRFISDISFACYYLDRFDHVFVSTKTFFPCERLDSCFMISKNLTNSNALVLLGRTSRDFGGVLYSRKRCSPAP